MSRAIRILGLLVLTFVHVSSTVGAAEEGLIAHYTFDEGKGAQAADSSGENNHGRINKAGWVETGGGGHCLEFDGVSSFVDCGASPSLDVRGPMTATAWICPAGRQAAREPGILGKQFTSFLVTYYSDADVYWYANWGEGGAFTRATTRPGGWSHVAAVFDGKLLRLYVNGSLAGESPSKMSAINQGKNFFIGSVIGNPDATDVNFTATSAFKGFIDEVKLYKRALGVEEVRGQYEAQAAQDRDAMFEAPCVPVRNGKTIRKSKVAVTAGPRGGIQISNGNSFFTLDSRFSYPGDKVGWNVLSETEGAGEAAWRTTVRRVNSSSLRIEAWSDRYLLVRIIRLGKGRIEIEDLLKNRTAEPVGVMIEHGIVTPVAMTNVSVGNSAETPTLFFSQEEGDFGIVAEDDIGRL